MDIPDWIKRSLGERLIYYSENGNINRVIEILNSGVDIDYGGGDYNQTALISSARDGQYEIVKLLLERGANPDIKDTLSNTALMYSVYFVKDSDLSIVELLLESGADPNIRDNDGETAYDIALKSNSRNIEIINILKYYMNIHHIHHIQALQRGNSTRRKLHTSMARRRSALSRFSDRHGLGEDIIQILNSRMSRPSHFDMIDEIPHNLEQYGSGKRSKGIKLKKKQKGGKKPCWDNYKMVGMKPKNGKMVPNCVYNKKLTKHSKKKTKRRY
tara:strand:+ start:140 stop:955 length:816 start_codon:yes stop_codon:yes gene_type:complete